MATLNAPRMSDSSFTTDAIHASGKAAAVIIPCSSRKTCVPDQRARAVTLPVLPQAQLESAWRKRLLTLNRTVEAGGLYGGRGSALGRRAAAAAGAPLYILSAGLGLVESRTRVPPYGITVSGRGEESVLSRVRDRFDPAAWWMAVSTGPMSCTFDDIVAGPSGAPVLIALTGPYAAMVATSLSRLAHRDLDRLRLFGWRLCEVLPPVLHASVMTYDARLEAVLPGTRCDFAQRALMHFVDQVLPRGPRDHREHASEVEASLRSLSAPKRVTRPRANDEDVLAWLHSALDGGGGIGRLLMQIRQAGIACEQTRFSRLYRLALETKVGQAE